MAGFRVDVFARQVERVVQLGWSDDRWLRPNTAPGQTATMKIRDVTTVLGHAYCITCLIWNRLNCSPIRPCFLTRCCFAIHRVVYQWTLGFYRRYPFRWIPQNSAELWWLISGRCFVLYLCTVRGEQSRDIKFIPHQKADEYCAHGCALMVFSLPVRFSSLVLTVMHM